MEKEPQVCADCRHFCRHYSRTGRNRYFPLDRGHCGYPRLRDKKADTPACPHYSLRKRPDKAEP